jgi:hypothetical protein
MVGDIDHRKLHADLLGNHRQLIATAGAHGSVSMRPWIQR